jgi:DNA-binding MarR family transcriptional regulator
MPPRRATAGAASPAASRAAPPRTDHFIVYKVGLLSKLFDRALKPWLAQHYELSVAEWRSLTFLYGGGPETVRELAAAMRVDKAEVSRALNTLGRRGLVSREDHPEDARSALFSITAAGRRLHDRVLPHRQAVHEALEAALTPTERKALGSALDKLTAHMLASGAPREEEKP